jgi:integrase
VTPIVAARWYRILQGRIEEPTAQTYLGHLKTFLAHLVDKRKLRRNPVEVEFDRIKKARRKAFCTKEQVTALLQANSDPQMAFILYCGFHAGLRREEIGEARPEWFDLDAGLLHLQRSDTWEPKDRDDRTIPLTEEFIAFLRHYGRPSPFMIEPKKLAKKKWRYRYDFRRPFQQLVKSIGLDWVHIHTMRHTFGSLKVSDGVSLYKVAVWLGDLERVVQDHYGYLIPKDLEIERGL